jgi:hypothetical protein
MMQAPGLSNFSNLEAQARRHAPGTRMTNDGVATNDGGCPHFNIKFHFGDSAVTVLKLKFNLVTIVSPFYF